MSSKLRVYEVARDLGMDNKELVTLLQSIGFSEIKNHMSVVPSEAIDRAKRQLERKNEPSKVVEERIRPTVVKRRTAAKRPEDGAPGGSGAADSSSAISAAQPVSREGAREGSSHGVHHPTASESALATAKVREAQVREAQARIAQSRDAQPRPTPATEGASDAIPIVAAGAEAKVATMADLTPRDVSHERPRDVPAAASVAGAAVGPSVGATEPTKAAVARPGVFRIDGGASKTQPASPGPIPAATAAGAHAKATVSSAAASGGEAPQASASAGPGQVASAGTDAVATATAKTSEPLAASPSPVGPPPAASSSESADVASPAASAAGSSGGPGQIAAQAESLPAQRSEQEAPVSTVSRSADDGSGGAPQTPADSVKVDELKYQTAAAVAAKPSTLEPSVASGAVTRPSVAQPQVQVGSPNRGAVPATTGPRVIASPAPGARPSTPPGPTTPSRPSSPPRTGIEVWEGRPGVPMSPAHRAPVPRRVQYDAKAGANAMQRRPGQPAQRMARGTRGKGPGPMGAAGGLGRGGPMGGRQSGAPPATQERGAHKRVVKIEGSVGLQNLGNSMGVKAHEVLRKLIMLGMTGVNINSTLDADTAKIVASEFGWDVSDVAVSEEQALVIAQGVETEADTGEREPRPPVVTVMGHVDHGKTSLLDQIRKANVAAGEAGGITQHIGAYSVDTARGRITFLDTPGHAAFTAMRMRGAQTTDIVILVVAADDGVMPQTREAVSHAKLAKVPLVVAINKCDKPEAQPDRCRRELAELGLVPEEWGGDTLFTEVSAHTGKGVDELLERVLLQAEMLDLRANPNKLAVGVVIEAQLDRGRGPVATMLVTDGTLRRGDVLLVGAASGKVRALVDSMGRNLAEAGPSTPVEVIGLNDVPAAGDPVHVVKDLKKAQELADSRKIKERRSLMPSGGQRLTLEELYKAMKETEQLELKVIVKADVHGSVEAVSDALVRLSTDKVKVTVVHTAAGAITEGDVNLAVAAGAIIIGFNVRPAGKAAALAAQEKVEIRQYNIIYNVVDDVKAAMEGLLSPSLVEKVLGQAQVRQVFRVSKAGNVAGCMVTQGVIRRAAGIRVMRDGATIWSGKLSALKRFKDDAREVKEGFDCGISLDGYQDIKEADILECFEMEEVRQTL